MPERYEVCTVAELPPGEREIVEVNGLSIGVFNVDGEYHALANVCPHQLAPLCEGQITGEMVSDSVGEFELIRDGEIIRCPWHGWKFDIADGTSVFNPHALRTRTYEVTVESKAEGETEEENRTSEEGETNGEGGTNAKNETSAEDEIRDEDETDEDGDESETDEDAYGTDLSGDEPPIDTYPVEVEEDVVVLYV